MAHYAVTRERGPAWDAVRSMREQDQWAEHAEFMEALVHDRFVIIGGPLGAGKRTLLIVDAGSEDEIHARLAADPWTPMELLRVTKVEPWEILLGDMPTSRG